MSFAIEQPFCIASITKLYTAAIIMQLRREGALTLEAPAAAVLGDEARHGLVVHGGRDYGPEITVRELLSNTSGVPDYFEQKRPDGGSYLGDTLAHDAWLDVTGQLDIARGMRSQFAPSAQGRAQYSDTNFMLLGLVIEAVTSNSYEQELSDRVLTPLALDATWLFTRETVDRYDELTPVLYGRAPLRTPQTIASSWAAGAIVSTPLDQLRFLRAFTGGELFPASYLAEMTAQWNSVFSPAVPLEYGTGLMRFRLPRWQSPFPTIPEMIGHSGSLGTLLYYVSERDLYVSGTLNQLRSRSLPYPLLARLVAQFS